MGQGSGNERGFMRGADERSGQRHRVPMPPQVDPDPDGNRAARRAARPATVKVAQVWADCDPRAAGRLVVVVAVGRRQAEVALVDQRGRPWSGLPDGAEQRARPGRRTMVRLDRFRPGSTGYRLVSEPAAPCVCCAAVRKTRENRAAGLPVRRAVSTVIVCWCEGWCGEQDCSHVPPRG